MLYIQPCANGNLLFLQRKNQSGQVMHSIRYTYPNGNNRLGAITSTGIASSVYQYDALGNLVRDNAEGLTVGWNAMGKVDTIHRNGSLLSSFRYSPTGQRQVKTDSSGTTFYIHDATGNVMCVYKLQGDTLTATERYLYGNKRLGMLEQQVWMTANNAGLQDSNTIGVRVYEFTDHLGNVTYTAQDRKWLVLDSYGQLQFIPATVNYTDYYPFGYPMWERSYDNGGYRYFFNGQEGDNEVLGEGALAGYEFRQYDTRLGRWWGVDPDVSKFPGESPFLFCGGNPILYLDKYGRYKLPEKEAKKSAIFAKYLNSYMKKDVLNSSNIMRGLQLYGELTVAEIEELLTPGKGPEIYIVKSNDISNASGELIWRDKNTSTIYINQDIINLLNTADDNTRQAALLFVISTLLHETAHYGDRMHGGYDEDNLDAYYKNGYDYEGYPVLKSAYSDRGLVFESDVYFYEGVSNMEEYWTRTIDNLQDAMEVVKEKSKTEEGRKDLPTVPKP